MDKIIADLERLAKLRNELFQAMEGFEAERLAILEPVRESLRELEARMTEETAEIRMTIGLLEQQIERGVLERGVSVFGQELMAVYSKGRITWDQKGLAGYALSHPEISALRKEGAPSVSIKQVK